MVLVFWGSCSKLLQKFFVVHSKLGQRFQRHGAVLLVEMRDFFSHRVVQTLQEIFISHAFALASFCISVNILLEAHTRVASGSMESGDSMQSVCEVL